MRTILTTVGTSLLSNARRSLDLGLDQQVEQQQLINYLRHADPVKACAETNSLARLLQEDDRIVFLHSQTDEGKQCAQALHQHYTAKDYNTDLQKVPDLAYGESRFKVRGLRSLVATTIDLIRQHRERGRDVFINATGGFKAEIAYATLVGLLFDVPVYYIHEAFRDIIEMPPTPISWDYSLLADYEEFFEWISADYRPTVEVDERLHNLPDEVRLLLAEEEDFTLMSPTGEAYYEAYQDMQQVYVGIPILLSGEAWQTYEQKDASIRELFNRALRKLRSPQLRRSGSGQVNNCDCFVYQKGQHLDERIFWFEGDDEVVHVCELARHSDGSYDRLIQRGVQRSRYCDFQPWQQE